LEGPFSLWGREEMEEKQSYLPVVGPPDRKKNKGRTGRPKIEINWDDFEKLCAMQCTENEVAAWFKCSLDTIERAVKRQFKRTFADIYAEYKSFGRASLRRQQWLKAALGDTGMLIWLGKQHLEQRDRPEENRNERDLTLRIIFDEKNGGNGEDKEITATAGNRGPFEEAVRQTTGGNRQQGEA
jgi:hypothetical protein